ncbi:hypothetical protein HY498_01460 [Candidatus Woesearchaeota archaeon]|nr:hypothetical protein [Candidatus Woesearchaeota archaeon]
METNPLPKWIMKKYALLWQKLQDKEFTYKDVVDLFKDENINVIRTMISQLRKNGWLTFIPDQNDSRKRIYKLKSPEQAVKEIKDKK